MPTFDRRNLGRPFRAKVKHQYKERYLGNYPTYQEALLVEQAKRLELTGRATYEPHNRWGGRLSG